MRMRIRLRTLTATNRLKSHKSLILFVQQTKKHTHITYAILYEWKSKHPTQKKRETITPHVMSFF